MAASDTPRLSWTGLDPFDWLRQWQTIWSGAADNLIQPILPGWTFYINSNNSTAPQTEIDVVAKHSYGRELGRISDALELLITERNAKVTDKKPFSDFLTMKHEIDTVKEEAAAARIEQIKNDLALLASTNKAQYKNLRAALLEALS